MKNHYMNGNDARTSYIRLLQFVQLLLKVDAENYDAGSQFVKSIYQAVEEKESFENLMTDATNCEETDLHQWAEEVRQSGGNSAFALDAFLLWHEMEAGETGLEALSGFFEATSFDQDVVSEAARAAKLIHDKGLKGIAFEDWVLCFRAKKYFGEKNWNQALDLYRKAYEKQGVFAGEAAYEIGNIYEEKGNLQGRVKWFEKSAKEGYDKGMCALGDCYLNGEGVEKDLDKAMEWYQNAYDLHGEKEGYAANAIGVVYWNKSDRERAKVWIQRGVDLGNELAMWDMGYLYKNGFSENGCWVHDDEKAMEYWEKTYEMHGEKATSAAIEIAKYYQYKDKEKAMKWYQRAAELGNDSAMYELGEMYRGLMQFSLFGIAEEDAENAKKAMEWYQRAAELGNDSAMYELGKMYQKKASSIRMNEEEMENAKKAIYWYQKVYENRGNDAGDAACYIADIYWSICLNKRVKSSMEAARKRNPSLRNEADFEFKKAEEWYLRAVDLESEGKAMCGLGDLYTDKNPAKAMQWYRKAYEIQRNWMVTDRAANGIRELGGEV